MNGETLNDCGCCEGLASETPTLVSNRDGLRAIAYRCGTHAEFKASMLAALSSSKQPALLGLNTRDDDDFSIALLDAWAAVGDVLTFYQERIANESYLRTATERQSLLQLARLIGYELRPGVAASTYLAFTLEEAAGAPRILTIDVGTKVQSIPGPNEKAQTFETIEKIEARVEWNAIKAQTTKTQEITAKTEAIYLKGTANNLRKGDALLFLDPKLPLGDMRSWAFTRVSDVTLDSAADRTLVELESAASNFAPQAPAHVEVYAFRQHAALFGHNAPDPRVLAKDTRTALKDSILSDGTDWTFPISDNLLDLDAVYPGIVLGPDSWLVFQRGTVQALCKIESVFEIGRKDFALAAKVSRLGVSLVASPTVEINAFSGAFLRSTTVFAQSEKLTLAEAPVDEQAVSGNTIHLVRAAADFRKGQKLAFFVKDATDNFQFSTLVTVESVRPNGAVTALTFLPALSQELDVRKIYVNANIALATHGETVEEIIGSGDASQSYQRFTLRQPPLTYVHGASASGTDSTLQLRVNDLLWHETPTLFGRGPRDRVFVTHTADDGKTTVQFGDGNNGARLPSAQENVRARYRKGLGLEGLVKAGQLSMLMSRPLGLKEVTNPSDATGADDRESLDNARSNAPLTVLTLDRIVSLRDYEDFARAYAGVAKALATWTWDGHTRGVFITIAGPKGAEIDLESDFGANLLSAIRDASDPFVPLQIKSYRKDAALFHLAARVKIDPDYETPRVLSSVESALRAQFSFEARSFGQPVAESEVIAVMQDVEGVVAVDLRKLYRIGQTSADRLLAALPAAGASGAIEPAELLTLDSAPLDQLDLME